MTMTDPIADMLTRIRNANVAFHDDVPMPSSKLKEAVAKILEREGYISGYEVDDQPGRPGRRLTIRMKYSSDRRRTISGLKRVSRPGPARLLEGRRCAARARRHGHRNSVNERGPAHRPRSARAQSRRRSPLPGLVTELVMSRIGQQPITIPSGVDVTIDGGRVGVKGPKGELDYTLVGGVSVTPNDDGLLVERVDDSRSNRSLHGLQRTLIANMIIGVSEGFVKELEIVGVGYRAQAQGPDKIEVLVGFSHPVYVEAPPGRDLRGPAADAHHRPRLRQATRRSGCRRHPQASQARALQGQGHPLRR